MSNSDMTEISKILDEFLTANPQPAVEDWKRLMDQFPQHAGAIADAALVRHGYVHVEDRVPTDSKESRELFNATISRVLNLVYKTSSPLLKDAKDRVDAIKGPSVKKVAQDIGLGPYPSLLNGILVGRTMAPMRVLSSLERVLEVPVFALVALFRQTFAETEMPAYKASGAKPHVPIRPCSWEEAVRSLKLPENETTRLLNLAKQD